MDKVDLPQALESNDLYRVVQSKPAYSVWTPRHFRTLECIAFRSDPRIKQYEQALDRVATVCGDTAISHQASYVITGGLSIPLTLNAQNPEIQPEFYREHRAIHIGISRDELPKIVEEAAKHNYFLFSRSVLFGVFGGSEKKQDWYVPLSWSEVNKLSEGKRLRRALRIWSRSKNLRLVHMEYADIQPHTKITDYLWNYNLFF